MTSTARRLTADLAAFTVRTSYAEIPDEAVANAKVAILDTVAGAFAAARFPVGSIVIDSVRASGESGSALIWPSGLRVSAPTAAYVNGHLANALDFDNSLHLDTHVLPAGLALAEQLKVSGRQFLEAYLVAREVGARLMRAVDGKRTEGNGVSHRGWWHVGLVGPLDAALVASRLLELDEDATRHAIGIASASVGGFRRSLGTMAKSLHSGQAARDGIQAALLAQQGFTGDPDILEAPMGFIEALCPGGEFDYGAVYDGLGSSYQLSSPPKMKPYPACGPAIAKIDSVLEILAATPVVADEIDRVLVNFNEHSLFRTGASDSIEAGFSTPYLVAVTVLDGRFGLEQLAEARVHDPAVRQLMQRIQHDPVAPVGRVRIILRDGRELAAGSKNRRWLSTWDDAAQKFDQVAGAQLGQAAEEFRTALAGLEEVSDVNRLSSRLQAAERAG